MFHVMLHVKHRCRHTSAIQGLGDVEKWSDLKDEDIQAKVARLEALPCRKCWMKEQGLIDTWFVEIPEGL